MLPDAVLLELTPPHSRWPVRAEREVARVRRALGPACRAVHHVGSTSVPGLPAVPVIDLVAELDGGTPDATAGLRLMIHGFLFIAREPSCTLHGVEDAITGHRQAELRCYPIDHGEVQALVAFFAFLRAAPAVATEYDAMKRHARTLHGAGSPEYCAAKDAWMRKWHTAAHQDGALS